MNSASFFEDKRVQAQAYKAIFSALQKMAEARGIKLEPKEAKVETVKDAVPITMLGALRTADANSGGIFCLGFLDPQWIPKFQEMFAKANPGPKDKPSEHDLMMELYKLIEADLKSRGGAIDPKRSIILLDAALGGWKNVAVASYLEIPIGTPSGEMLMVMPLFDTAFADKKTEEFYGFAPNTRIMVVDDSPTSRISSRQHLAMAGYFHLDETPDGHSCLTKLKGSRPPFGLVVADWHMPVMSGFELLKQVRATPEIKNLPYILATGEKKKEEIMAALKEGVTGYLIKPLEPTSFFKYLKAAHEVVKAKQK